MHVGIYERTPATTNYNASANGASGVSNEMQEVRARVVHRRDARLRESVMKVEWNSEMQREKEREETEGKEKMKKKRMQKRIRVQGRKGSKSKGSKKTKSRIESVTKKRNGEGKREKDTHIRG